MIEEPVQTVTNQVQETALEQAVVTRSLGNTSIVCLTFLLLHRFIQSHFSTGLSLEEALGIPAVLGLAGFLLKYLPKPAQKRITHALARSVSSKYTTHWTLTFLAVVTVVSVAITTVEVNWTGKQPLEILKNGSQISKAEEGRSTLNLFVLSFRPVSIKVKSYSVTVHPWPLLRSQVTIPFYVTQSDVPELGDIENYLDLSLLQNNQARYVNEALSRVEHLRRTNTNISSDALERLDDIANIIQQTLVEARESDIKDHLMEVYQEKYPYDSWLPALRGLVAFSKYDFSGAIEAIKASDNKPGSWPRVSTMRFLKATCYLRLANQIRLNQQQKNEVTTALANAEQEYDGVVSEMLRNSDHEYVTMVRPAAYVFRGITAFYQRDYGAAQTNFETVLGLDGADSALKARAANGIGYLAFLRGDMHGASSGFNRALEYDGSIAIARVNQGFLLLVQGTFEAARAHFQRLLSDERIKLKSPRDILLARLGLAHALDWQGKQLESLTIYTDVLASLDHHDFSEVQNQKLRLAYVYDAIGSKIYLFNRDYFALEPFALALFGRSCKYYCEVNDNDLVQNFGDTKSDLGAQLNRDITAALALSSHDWKDAYQSLPGILKVDSRIAGSQCSCGGAK